MSTIITEKKQIKRVKKGIKILKYATKKDITLKEAYEKFNKERGFVHELFLRLNKKPYRRPKFKAVPDKLKNKFLKLHSRFNQK